MFDGHARIRHEEGMERASVGQHVKGLSTLGAPREGTVAKIEMAGYRLTDGTFIPFGRLEGEKEGPKQATAARPPIVRWAEGEHPGGYTTHGVLAGRYVGQARNRMNADSGELLTHAFIGDKTTSPCGKKLDNMSDVDERSIPSCPRCRAAVTKLKPV
jgi:hypothetical protein